MTRYGKIFLYFLSIAALAWILPWLYSFATPHTQSAPFTLLSEVDDQFLSNAPSGDKGLTMIDQDGKTYTKSEIDSMLPTLYFRQLIADSRMPDSLRGLPMTPKDIQTGNFMFRSSPSDINNRPVGLYPLLESMSGRVDLEMPSDVFRITDRGIEFIDMATNTVNKEKSRLFTEAMEKKGFAFPAVEINGNPTTRKEYDNGYLLIDSAGKVFRLMMVKERPFVRETGIDPALGMRHASVTEFRSKRYFGFLTDGNHNLYALDKDYNLVKLPVERFDPETESLMIIANMFNWTIRIDGDSEVRWYGIDSDDHSLIRDRQMEFAPGTARKIAEYIFPFSLSFTSYNDKYAYPRLEDISYKALILNIVLAGVLVVIRRRKNKSLLLPALVTAVTGLYGFIAYLLLKVPPAGR